MALFLLDKSSASAGTLLGDALSIVCSFLRHLRHRQPAAGGQIPRRDLHRLDAPAVRCRSTAVSAGGTAAGLAGGLHAGLAEYPVHGDLSRLCRVHSLELGDCPAWRSHRHPFSLLVPIASGALSALFFGVVAAKLIGAALVLAGLVIVRVRFARPAAWKERQGSVPTTDSKMYQTMHRQPAEIERLVPKGGTRLRQETRLLALARRIFVVGIGTSWHAAMVGAWLLREAGCDARPVSSFDFALYPVVPAHRRRCGRGHGAYRSEDVLCCLHEAGERCRRASAVGGQSHPDHPGSQLVLRTVEREQSAAYTSSHLAAMTVLAQVATVLGEQRDMTATSGFRPALDPTSPTNQTVLAREEELVRWRRTPWRARSMPSAPGRMRPPRSSWLSRRARPPTSRSTPCRPSIPARPHGGLQRGHLLIAITAPGNAYQRVAEICAVANAMGGRLWLVGSSVAATPQATIFTLPEMPELISPLLAVVPMQMLAYTMAVLRGTHPAFPPQRSPLQRRVWFADALRVGKDERGRPAFSGMRLLALSDSCQCRDVLAC